MAYPPCSMDSSDAAEADMAHAAVDHLCMPRRGPVSPAVVGRAEKRASLDDLARDARARLLRVVARLHPAARRPRRPAAGLRWVGFVALGEPVAGPLPDIADHVVEAVAIGREAADRRGALEAVGLQILPRKIPLPESRHHASPGGELLAPGVFGALQPAAGGELPFRLARQLLTAPMGIGQRILIGDLDHGVVLPAGDTAALALGMAPAGARSPAPPVADIAQVDRTLAFVEDEGAGRQHGRRGTRKVGGVQRPLRHGDV